MLDKKYRPAIEELIALYKKEVLNSVCPFCLVTVNEMHANCQKCPWHAYAKSDKSCVCRLEKDLKDRINRLEGWLIRMDNDE